MLLLASRDRMVSWAWGHSLALALFISTVGGIAVADEAATIAILGSDTRGHDLSERALDGSLSQSTEQGILRILEHWRDHWGRALFRIFYLCLPAGIIVFGYSRVRWLK